MQIWLDMDGTIADLYGQKNWLDDLINGRTAPYENAKPLGNMSLLARLLNKAQRNGHEIGVISWTAKGSTAEYAERVAQAKTKWLSKHLKSVKFNRVEIVEYGQPKQVGRVGILFDDEEHNRNMWGKGAYVPQDMVQVLKAL